MWCPSVQSTAHEIAAVMARQVIQDQQHPRTFLQELASDPLDGLGSG